MSQKNKCDFRNAHIRMVKALESSSPVMVYYRTLKLLSIIKLQSVMYKTGVKCSKRLDFRVTPCYMYLKTASLFDCSSVRAQACNTFLFISGIMLDSWTKFRKLSEPAPVRRCGLFTDSRGEEPRSFCMRWPTCVCWRDVTGEWGRRMDCHTPHRGQIGVVTCGNACCPHCTCLNKNGCTRCGSSAVCKTRRTEFSLNWNKICQCEPKWHCTFYEQIILWHHHKRFFCILPCKG